MMSYKQAETRKLKKKVENYNNKEKLKKKKTF